MRQAYGYMRKAEMRSKALTEALRKQAKVAGGLRDLGGTDPTYNGKAADEVAELALSLNLPPEKWTLRHQTSRAYHLRHGLAIAHGTKNSG